MIKAIFAANHYTCTVGRFMDISVIIVNYNVKYFLEQCLLSVQKALKGLQGEIIVIDNCSADGSREYLCPAFPAVNFIWNEKNIGFGKACNLGLTKATGKYILFLNPDTIVPEDCFEKSIAFMEMQADAGAMGIRMLDGSGNFLKESKRAFPSPQTSFYKLIGLARLFPHSKLFSQYHLGYLDEHKNHKVDVLAGAFMLVKKEVLDKTGGFDEVFFMYGEDVDLSYRIQKAGYTNYYFSESSIIHFKGESTRKGSLNYVKMFYQAMSVFVKKHYGSQKAGVFNFFIQSAIWIRAIISSIGHFIKGFGLPLIDAVFILGSFLAMKFIWGHYVKPEVIYEKRLWIAVIPLFTVIYLLIAYYTGLYNKYFRQGNLNRSALTATLTVLAIYSLLPETLRFSRGIILFGAVLAYIMLSLIRKIMIAGNIIEPESSFYASRTLLVCGDKDYDEIKSLVYETGIDQQVFGRIGIEKTAVDTLGTIEQIPVLAEELNIKNLLFGEGELTNKKIIEQVQLLSLQYMFHAKGSHSIVSSYSKNEAGESLAMEKVFKLARPVNRRNKRLWDIAYALLFLATFPLHFIFQPKPFRFFSNIFSVLMGTKTWVGYCTFQQQLPLLKKGVITTTGLPAGMNHLSAENLAKTDYWYARDYHTNNDTRLIIKNYKKLSAD